MSNVIFIGKKNGETKIALFENNNIAELYMDNQNNGGIMGNVYRGKIQSVLPGMQAAFVDIGLGKNAYLYTGDKNSKIKLSISSGTKTKHLTPGGSITVQVLKETKGDKGPRATTNITFAGMYTICIPNSTGVYVSKKIDEQKERKRLQKIGYKICPEDFGVIIRTGAKGISSKLIQKDFNYTMEKINDVIKKELSAIVPSLLCKGSNIVEFSIRELFGQETDKLLIDNKELLKEARAVLDMYNPKMVSKVKYVDSSDSEYWHNKIDANIQKILNNKVWLKCGGYIIINKTEALTAIDVNTGKNIGKNNLRNTFFETNMQAAEEIARQLRLRDIGGIIIIDFIDMKSEEDKKQLIRKFKKALSKDRMRTVVAGITNLNLVEMTRKRSRPDLNISVTKRCQSCKGSGFVRR